MAHLTQTQRAQLEQQLRHRELDLHADLQSEQEQDEDYRRVVEQARDAGDVASAMSLTDLNHAEMARDARELREIGIALRRVNQADYGVCRECGEDIPFARLRAQPTAQRCSRCQAHHERMFAGGGRGATM